MAEPVLTSAQVQVLHLFFALAESEGFNLAGGAGLVAVGLSERPTDDVDLFAPDASIPSAAAALEVAATASGWTVERLRDADTFCRLVVRTAAGEETMVDLAQDAGPIAEPTITAVGPTYPGPELAARKVLALFDRAALRDFVDVDRVLGVHPEEQLLGLASSIDEGFQVAVLVQMLRRLDRYADEQIAGYRVDPTVLRDRFRRWAAALAEAT